MDYSPLPGPSGCVPPLSACCCRRADDAIVHQANLEYMMDFCTFDNGFEVEPSCPSCGHYNAMLVDNDPSREAVTGLLNADHRKCRDCGHKAVALAS